MDPRTDLRLAHQRQADFERRAVEHRHARTLRPRRPLPTLPRRRRAAVTVCPTVCPA